MTSLAVSNFEAAGSTLEAPLLSILIISRTVENLNGALAGVASSGFFDPLEVLCSWNGDPGDLSRIHQPDGVALRIVEQQPYNFARNNNGLALHARGDLVLFMNDDIVLDHGALGRAVEAIRDPGVGIVGINLRYGDGRLQHAGVFFDEEGKPYHRHKHQVQWTDPAVAADMFVPCVTGAFILMRRQEFNALRFDEAFQVCGEDIALNLSYRERFDREILYLAGATALHLENATRKQAGKTKTPPEDMERIRAYSGRMRDGRTLTQVRRPRVRIVTEKPGWIMYRKAEEIQKHMGAEHVRINEDWPEAEVNYYINFHHFRESRRPGLLIANFTHYDPAIMSTKFEEVGHEADHCICVSQATADALVAKGVDEKKISVVVVGADAKFQPKLTLGVVGRVYEGGRKGEDIVQQLAADKEIRKHVRIVATTPEWEVPVWQFEDQADFYRAIDYLLVPSRIEGGPVPFMEALACGTMAIAPEIGVIPQFPHVSYPVGDVAALREVILDLARRHIGQREFLTAKMRGLDWSGWAVEHEKIFRRLLWDRDTRTSPAVARPAPSTARKSIALITTNDNNFAGGSEVWWRETALRLAQMQHDVSVLIKKWAPKPDFVTVLEQAGIKVLHKEDQGFGRLTESRPDLVVVSIGDQDDGIEYYEDLRKARLAYVIVNRLTKEERFWPIRPAKQGAVKAGYLGAKAVFFASDNNRRVMEERLGCALPHAGRIYSPNHADRSAPVPWPPVTSGIRIAFPANVLFQHKGHDLLIEALMAAKWRHRDLVVNVYGVGRDLERLEQLIKDNDLAGAVRLCGPVVRVGSERDIAGIWTDNHAIIAPSRMEGFPNMVLNAMISGRMPIVTDIGGHREIIEDGVNGFIAADPTVEALDEALERAWSARQDWQAIGARARVAALTYLPDDPVADAACKLLRLAETMGRPPCIPHAAPAPTDGNLADEAN